MASPDREAGFENQEVKRSGKPAEERRESRLGHGLRQLWYVSPFYELEESYVKQKIPDVEPELGKRRKVVLDYAAQEYAEHRRSGSRMRRSYFFFQSLTILAASAATVLNVVADESHKWIAAIPAAVAALAASALAAFRFERHALRHRRGAAQLKSERWAFVGGSGAYRGHRHGAPTHQVAVAIERFFERVDRIARDADEDVEQESEAQRMSTSCRRAPQTEDRAETPPG
jgi:hypothetical protein